MQGCTAGCLWNIQLEMCGRLGQLSIHSPLFWKQILYSPFGKLLITSFPHSILLVPVGLSSPPLNSRRKHVIQVWLTQVMVMIWKWTRDSVWPSEAQALGFFWHCGQGQAFFLLGLLCWWHVILELLVAILSLLWVSLHGNEADTEQFQDMETESCCHWLSTCIHPSAVNGFFRYRNQCIPYFLMPIFKMKISYLDHCDWESRT